MGRGPTALIVCGGRGTRLGPLGKVVNKNLLPCGDIPIVVAAANAVIEEFDCSHCLFLTGHLGWQLEQVIPSYIDGIEISFAEDLSGRGTAAAVSSVVTDHGFDEFVYAHGNVSIGRESVRSVARAADAAGAGGSVIAVSSAEIAPTHPKVDIRHGTLTRNEPGSSLFYSVGLALFREASWAGSWLGPAGQTLEDLLIERDLGGSEIRAVDIGSDWDHLEDLSFYNRYPEVRVEDFPPIAQFCA